MNMMVWVRPSGNFDCQVGKYHYLFNSCDDRDDDISLVNPDEMLKKECDQSVNVKSSNQLKWADVKESARDVD